MHFILQPDKAFLCFPQLTVLLWLLGFMHFSLLHILTCNLLNGCRIKCPYDYVYSWSRCSVSCADAGENAYCLIKIGFSHIAFFLRASLGSDFTSHSLLISPLF